jgi:hypothetical protein
VKAVSAGSDAPGLVLVRIQQETDAKNSKSSPKSKSKRSRLDMEEDSNSKGIFVGQGVDEDILAASAKAYLNAINRLLVNERRYLGLGRNVDV